MLPTCVPIKCGNYSLETRRQKSDLLFSYCRNKGKVYVLYFIEGEASRIKVSNWNRYIQENRNNKS